MSVVVAQPPEVRLEHRDPVQTTMPNDLLEALLASCQKPIVAKAGPGFGRKLVPYFPAEDPKLTARTKAGTRSNTSPQQARRKAAANAVALVAAAKNASKSTKASASKLTPAEAEKTRALKMATLMSSWAGPGFCVSPTPEKLPMPPSSLLD